MDIISTGSEIFMATFSSYVNQFLDWGKFIFFNLVIINVVWMCLWYAFDKNTFSESMPDFIKRFFIISLFYTIMVNPSWLMQMLRTAQHMGHTLTNTPIDPSSLITAGIGIANKIILPIGKTSFFSSIFGVIIIAIVYICVLFVFISVALELALTLITTTALISVASFFLGFAALGATTQIARQTLDVILANCVKLLGIYLVVAAGSNSITIISNYIPTHMGSLDPYGWIVAIAFLFWRISRTIPQQLAHIVSGAIQDHQGGQAAAALALSTMRYASVLTPAATVAVSAAKEIAKVAGGTMHNATAQFNRATSQGANIKAGMGTAVGGSLAEVGKAVGSKVSDHFKHVANKMAGGPGSQQTNRSVSERIYQSTQDINSEASQNRSDKSKHQKPETSQPSSQEYKKGQESKKKEEPFSKPVSSKKNADGVNPPKKKK